MAEEVAGGLQLQPPRAQALHPSNLIFTPSSARLRPCALSHIYRYADEEASWKQVE